MYRTRYSDLVYVGGLFCSAVYPFVVYVSPWYNRVSKVDDWSNEASM